MMSSGYLEKREKLPIIKRENVYLVRMRRVATQRQVCFHI